MNSFIYRDKRRQQLESALATPGGVAADLKALLQKEHDALQTDDWTLADNTYGAVGKDWLWKLTTPVKPMVDDDPVLQALQSAAALSNASAAAIDALLRNPGIPPVDWWQQVRAAVSNEETVLEELLWAAHRRWILQPPGERPYPFDDVGVLLPVRLETLFDAPGSPENNNPGSWKLSLRVIPDEASICRHNTFVSQGELNALQTFWQSIQQPGDPADSWLDGDKAIVAWKLLGDRVGGARAAWLTGSIPLRLTNGVIIPELPADMPAETQPNRVGGFPPELHVIVTTTDNVNGQTKHTIGRLPEDKDLFIDPDNLALPLPDKEMEMEKKNWWISWEAARKVGLGGEFMLPEGITPNNIAALYVLGIGEETPTAHFRAHADAGALALLRPGTATNTVQGSATTDMDDNATDWRKIAQLKLRQRLNGLSQAAGAAQAMEFQLTGSANNLPFFTGADAPDDTSESQLMVQALWPALWGHYLKEVWQAGEDGYEIADWAFNHLCPEGPLMPLRIGDQPYGLLPVTSLTSWEPFTIAGAPETSRQRMEKKMAALFNQLRLQWANGAKDKRSVVGKSTADFMDILGQDAFSNRYVWRTRLPADMVLAPMGINDVLRREEFVSRAISAWKAGRELLDRIPAIPYLAVGNYHYNPLPLVKPTRMLYKQRNRDDREPMPLPAFLELLYNYPLAWSLEAYDLDHFMQEPGHVDYQLRSLPDSLLVRLLVYAVQLTHAWKKSGAVSQIAQQVLDMQQKSALIIAEEINADGVGKEQDPLDPLPVFVSKMPEGKRLQLERGLRATLDSAAHRIDPWITGFAWQRLDQHSRSETHLHKLGVYGWLDGPFEGKPGPTDAGRLHTPSYNQTVTALILRDKYLSASGNALVNEAGDTPWHMDITSPKARLAEELADEVRLGFHIYEIIGLHLENIIGDHQQVKLLRTDPRYAMRPERKDPNEVCNGQNALQGLLKGDPVFPLKPAQREALQLLADAMDTYGDLLMADGVMQLVNGQPARAAETMDAAAGFSRPPGFEFLQTPPSGYQLETVVLSALPYVAPGELINEKNPVRIADPSVAAFLEEQLGSNWKWRALKTGMPGEEVLGEVTLADLQLSPLEALAMPADLLGEIVQRKLGQQQARIAAPREHAQALALLAALGNRPAAGKDFISEKDTQQAIDTAIYTELKTRYSTLYTTGVTLVNEWRSAISANNIQPAHLRSALAWGIATTNETADKDALIAALTGMAIPVNATPLPVLVKTMADTLDNRLKAAPQPADLPAENKIAFPLDDHATNKQKNIPDGVPTLAQAIANLAAPGIRLAILAVWDKAALRNNTQILTRRAAASLDEDWLTIVAATRSNLARLEALQLELATPLLAWSSANDDPWQKSTVAANRNASRISLTRFVAAYGNTGTWTNEQMAVGIIDAFSEAIPFPQRTTMTAFGFNAPAAKAQQAILLAVPPRPKQRLDIPVLLDIIEETRELSHARTARMEDLPSMQPLTPTAWLQSSGPVRMRFEKPPLI